MKKLFAFIILGILIFSLAACGQSKSENSSAASAAPSAAVSPASESSEASSAVSSSSAGQSTETPIVGGWTKADSPIVTDEIKDLLEKATEGLTGASYTPIAYIGNQLVSGMNHAILCSITPVVPDAVSTYAVVTVYADLNGNAEILDILNSEAEVEPAPEGKELVGGWSAPETPAVTDEAKAALETALKEMTGAKYTPLALLATQIVSGTNYSLLCEVTAVTPDVEARYVIAHVYEDLEGKAEITDTFDFAVSEE